MRLVLALGAVLVLGACAHPERDLEQCKVVVGQTTGALASCLVRLHDWDAAEARRAELHYDAQVRADWLAAKAKCEKMIDSLLAGDVVEIRQQAKREQCEN